MPYPAWAEEGLIILHPGPVIDYRRVEEHIRELCARFNVRRSRLTRTWRVMMSNLLKTGCPRWSFSGSSSWRLQ